jgi:DNA-binding Lrp family transcriptional regulator
MALKPQDVFVVLKLVANGDRRPTYAQLAASLGMSASEVHASVKRAQQSGLLHGPEFHNRPRLASVEEFLVHGLKYAFPAERGELTRGVATSYGAAPLSALLTGGDDPVPVWPYAEGKHRGFAYLPLYKTAPQAALRDAEFHELLALADALRDSGMRERKIAQSEIHRRFREVHAA